MNHWRNQSDGLCRPPGIEVEWDFLGEVGRLRGSELCLRLRGSLLYELHRLIRQGHMLRGSEIWPSMSRGFGSG
jgi:hypothetical protein